MRRLRKGAFSVTGPRRPARLSRLGPVSLATIFPRLRRHPSLTLLRAITSLGPHVVTVATPEPFLIAAGIVGGENDDLGAAATRARCVVLFRIGGTMTVSHLPPPRQHTPRTSGRYHQSSVPRSPHRGS